MGSELTSRAPRRAAAALGLKSSSDHGIGAYTQTREDFVPRPAELKSSSDHGIGAYRGSGALALAA